MVYINEIKLDGKSYTSDLFEKIKSNIEDVVLVDRDNNEISLKDLVGEIISFEERLFSVENEEDIIKLFEIK